MIRPFKLAEVAALGLLFTSTQLFAVGIEDTSITGYYKVWESDGLYSPPGGLTEVIPAPPPPLDSYLVGTYAEPGSNIELADESDVSGNPLFPAWMVGAPATELTGDFGGADLIMLSSVTKADWEATDYRLTKDYVIDAGASVGVIITDADLDDPSSVPGLSNKQAFVEFPVFGADGSLAFNISDPNLSFVNLEGSDLQIGLSAILDSTTFLQALLDFFAPGSPPLTPPNVASEVVIYDWDGSGPTPFYGFDCIDSNQDAGDGPDHTKNSYSCTVGAVPEPGTVALFTLGLVGAGWMRARRHGRAF